MGMVKKAPKQDHKAPIASNTANIMGTCEEYGRVPKGSLPHWTVAGSRTIRDEKSREMNDKRNERRVARGQKPRRDRGRRPEVIRTEIREDGREVKVCESPDTYDLCEVKLGSYPNRPQRLDWAEPSAREQGWGDPNENMGQPISHEDLLEEYRKRNLRNAKSSRKSNGRKVIHEASALKCEPTLSREQRRERFHVTREHEKARESQPLANRIPDGRGRVVKAVDTSTARDESTQAAVVGAII